MFEIPGKAVAAHLRQAGIYRADIDALAIGMAGDGVLSGLGVSQQSTPNMTVAVAAGMIRIGGYFCFVSAASPTITTADATLDRIDLVTVDWNGAVSVQAGTPAAKPVSPVIPANSISLAQVYVPAADAAIGNAQIYDKRPIIPDTYDVAAEFLGSSLSNTAATSAGSIGEAGWSMSGTTAAPTFQAVTGRPGVLRSVTGTTSGNRTSLHFGSAANTAVLTPSQIARLCFVVRVPTITTLAVKFGLGQDLSAATVDQLGTAGAWVEFLPASSAKWRYCTRQGSSTTQNVDPGADVTATDWYVFCLIRKQNGNWQFMKNGALMFEHSTNLPTTDGNVGTTVHTLTAAARNLDHDFFGLNFAPLGNRWS